MIFAPTKTEKIVERQLYEARRLKLEHQAAAEHHQALAQMYGARELRLNNIKAQEKQQ